ncbi:ComEA family DNA-binding protein [Psychrobacter sp.]|uniref:ComEA family DNA-binding protein n=1 Tax=Psychrobacter sp. TaxID=56811 RepID=UPI003F9A2A59
MNDCYKLSCASVFGASAIRASWLKIAVFGLVLVLMRVSNANTAPCFDDTQQAYDYLIAQEEAKVQARDNATININTASEGELVSLHGIGSSKAQEIILYREMFGRFRAVEDLTKVKGIGAKTVEDNRSRLSVQD